MSVSSRAAMTDAEKKFATVTVEDLRTSFQKQLQGKIRDVVAKPDAAEVVNVMGKSAAFCGGSIGAGAGGDIRVIHVGPPSESELVLAHLCEGMYDALTRLMGGRTDRNTVLDNLEMVFLLIDEHCDGGIILEVDGAKLANSVLLRDDEVSPSPRAGSSSSTAAIPLGGMGLPMHGDMTLGQAFRQVGAQFISNLAQRNG
jgi:hypothetical protein